MKIKSKLVIILFALTIILLIEKSFANEIICKEGEVYNKCASACEPNCTNQNPVCIDMCMQGKCQCKEGFVRNEDNKCIPKEKCFKQENTSYTPSLKCGEGEEERSCPVCEATCQNPVIHICPLFCTKIPKCLCKAGYARVEKGKCIPISECPKESTTILPTKPTPIYPQFCCNPFLPCRICPQGQHCVGNPGERRCVSNVCNLLCRIGFECKILNNKPICIPKCNKGEELKECANRCEPKCGEPMRFCAEMCIIKPSCQCLPGYSRDSNGICIPRNECPTDQPKYCNKNCGFVYVCKIIDGEPKCVPPDFLNKTTTEPY